MVKNPRKTLIAKLDKITSEIVRKKASDENWMVKCISCDKVLHYKEAHCCHYIERWKYLFRWDYDNLRAGCAWCNTFNQQFHMRGYSLALVNEYGKEKVEEMISKSKQVHKVSIVYLRDLYEDRKKELVELNK